MGPVPRAQVGVPTCTSKVGLIRSVVSFEGDATATEIRARSSCERDWDEDVPAVASLALAGASDLDSPASARSEDGVQTRQNYTLAAGAV